MAREFFGTDGIRGRVGEHPITTEFVLKLGWAAGKVLAARGGSKILIGKDGKPIERFGSMTSPSSKKLLKAIESAL